MAKDKKAEKEKATIHERLLGLTKSRKGVNKTVNKMANRSFVDKRRGSR